MSIPVEALSLLAIAMTVGVCLLARRLATVRAWLPTTVQFLSGFVIPPAITWLVFAFDNDLQGNHNSGISLLIVWFLCVLAGMLFSRRTDRRAGTAK